MAIPDYQTLMLPVLKSSNSGEVRIRDVVEKLKGEFELTPEEAAELLPSGNQTIFSNRVHWAKTYLAKAGLVEATKRGSFQITPRGQAALNKNPATINNNYLSQFEDFEAFRGRGDASRSDTQTATSTSIDAETPDEIMRNAHRSIEESLSYDLLARIRAAPPEFFEKLIVNLLIKMGYGGSVTEAGRALGGTGDNGIDGVIDQDPLGLDRVYIQAKRYAEGNNVGSGAIRDFFGSLDRHKATKGLFVTTSQFSPSATETAEYLSKRIVLIDGRQLTRLMIRHNVGCKIAETLHIREIDEDFYE